MAAQRVFDIAELREMILLNVHDVKTLLLIQRTTSSFRATIQGSETLQRRLFFLPASPPEMSYNSIVNINPLLKYPWCRDPHHRSTGQDGRRTEYYATINFAHIPSKIESKDASWRRMLLCQPQPWGELSALLEVTPGRGFRRTQGLERLSTRWWRTERDVRRSTKAAVCVLLS